MNVTEHDPRAVPRRPAARRTGILALGILLLVTVSGCGSSLFGPPSPVARLTPPPGSYDEAVYVSPHRPNDERYYVAMSPNTPVDSFRRFHESLHIAATTTLWYYAVSAGGVRSPVIEAAYTITGASTPYIRQPEVWITERRFMSYELVWFIEPDWSPIDTHTPWYDLEYAVYSSAQDDIASYAEAEENGRLETGWVSEADRLTYRAGRPGEARYFNVFVRNRAGGVSAYGTRRFSSVPAPSVVFFDFGDPVLRAHPHLARHSFDPSLEPARSTGVGEPMAFGLGHVNDGLLADLAVVQSDGTNAVYRWYRPVGDGTYDTANPAAELYVEPASPLPRIIRIADMTGDGTGDFVFNTGTGDLRIVDASGAQITAIDGAEPRRFVIGDLTGNGANDIVSLNSSGITVWRSTGEASFTEVPQTWDGLGEPGNLRDIALADVDGDDRVDLIVARADEPAVLLFSGNGDGTFILSGDDATFSSVAEEATSLTVLDFTLNGMPDLFVGTADGQGSHVFLNNGNHAFNPLFQTESFGYSSGAVAADLNGNGWPDVIETFEGAPPRIWLNEWGGGLGASSVTLASTSTAQIATGQIR